MKVIRVKDYEAVSKRARDMVLEMISSLKSPVLGLATGSTPIGLYEQLIDSYKHGEVSFQRVTTFNLDEYVGLKRRDPNSYFYYMKEKLFNHIDISMERVHIPNGTADDLEKECRDYEQQILRHGPIDVQVLGLGVNGHIGFNEPGTPFTTRTHVVNLDTSTRIANARFFDSPEAVPKRAITMGIETIMESRSILLLVSGKEKANAVSRLIHSNEITPAFPASILRKHPHVIMIADEEALEGFEGFD